MNCNADKERLSAWIDDDLNAVEREQVEQHLAQCEVCRGVLDDLLAIHKAAQGLADDPGKEPADQWAAIRDAEMDANSAPKSDTDFAENVSSSGPVSASETGGGP